MKYGLNVTGKVRVFRKDKDITGKGKKTFTITDVWFNTSEKDDNGEWFNISTKLLFKKGLELPNNNDTIILEGFPIITGQGQYRKIAYMVTNWGYDEEDKGKKVSEPSGGWSNDPFANDGKPVEISDDDLPF